jgi:hypothetical protein
VVSSRNAKPFGKPSARHVETLLLLSPFLDLQSEQRYEIIAPAESSAYVRREIANMGKTLLLLHGRHFKPNETALTTLWLDTLAAGLARDRASVLPLFNAATKSFIYYGNISNAYLLEQGYEYDEAADLKDRRKVLKKLSTYKKSQFNKKTYNALPGKSFWGEALADLFAGPLAYARLSDPAIHLVAPDMKEYWNDDSAFSSDVRFPMIAPLKEAMDRNDEILVIAHSLGSMIAYDTFWKFCRMGEYRPTYADKKISLWITLGSPLGNETVRRNLHGGEASGERRYPNNIVDWVNLAAEDDYISHDQRLADDYAEMLDHGLVRSITDERIYNLAVRQGKSNPHNELGYLIHPAVTMRLADWLLA